MVRNLFRELWVLFYTFAKISILGYGGGPSLIPLIEADVVKVYHWMTSTEFADVLAIGYASPGLIGTKMAFIVGYKVQGIIGGIVATLGIILPPTLVILALYLFLHNFKSNPRVESMLRGLRPVVVALLLKVAIDLVPKSIISWPTGLIAVVSLALLFMTNIHPAILVLIGAAIGIILL